MRTRDAERRRNEGKLESERGGEDEAVCARASGGGCERLRKPGKANEGPQEQVHNNRALEGPTADPEGTYKFRLARPPVGRAHDFRLARPPVGRAHDFRPARPRVGWGPRLPPRPTPSRVGSTTSAPPDPKTGGAPNSASPDSQSGGPTSRASPDPELGDFVEKIFL
ncbi:hypothetical protein EJB05_54602, partial [Eragrostis curvula]